jgi:hypothetical protein
VSQPTLLESLRATVEQPKENRPRREGAAKERVRPRLPLLKQEGLFLRGPVPLSWLQAAGRLPGKTLHVALQLRFWAGVRKQSTVRLNLSRLADWGVHRTAAARGLAHLERAGLARVRKSPGGVATVTIVEERDGQSEPSGGTNTSMQSTDGE